jgi:hypothetical protein
MVALSIFFAVIGIALIANYFIDKKFGGQIRLGSLLI